MSDQAKTAEPISVLRDRLDEAILASSQAWNEIEQIDKCREAVKNELGRMLKDRLKATDEQRDSALKRHHEASLRLVTAREDYDAAIATLNNSTPPTP